MSENISILEGGQAKVFGHVQKLKISNSGGGSSLWVPEEAVPTGSLYVDKNGTYYASNDGYFGYDEVEVNIVKSVKGKKNNKPYDVTVDDNGFLHENELPAYIEITTPPTTLNYVDGQDISTEGWVVKAFYTDGTEYGDITDACTIEPTVADVTKIEPAGMTSDIADIQPYLPIKFNGNLRMDVEGSGNPGFLNYTFFSFKATSGRTAMCCKDIGDKVTTSFRAASSAPFKYGISNLDVYVENIVCDKDAVAFTYNEKTVYWTSIHSSVRSPLKSYNGVKNDVAVPIDESINQLLCWTMIYGTPVGGGQPITVKWKREDFEILSTTFNITVTQGPIPPNQSGTGG